MKTSELIGPALDWAVAKCNWDHTNAYLRKGEMQLRLPVSGIHEDWSPSTDWSQGGPIIERECLTVINAVGDGVWSAYPLADDPVKHRKSGPTPLIAAMRCFVASKLGDEVDVPKELL